MVLILACTKFWKFEVDCDIEYQENKLFWYLQNLISVKFFKTFQILFEC